MSIRSIPPSPIHSPEPFRSTTQHIDPFADSRTSASTHIDTDRYGEPDGHGSSSEDRHKDSDFVPARELRNTYLSRTISLLRTTHKWSAYTASAFTVIHFLNTGIAPLVSTSLGSLHFADENLTAARALYRLHGLTETVAVGGAIVVHVGAGVLVRVLVGVREVLRYGWSRARWDRYSWAAVGGYALVPLLLGHVAVNRYVPAALDIDVTSSVVGHYLSRHPGLGWILYGLFVSLGALHVADGLGLYLGWSRKTRWRVSAFVCGMWLTGLVKVGLHGVVGGIKGRQYDAIERYIIDSVKSFGPT